MAPSVAVFVINIFLVKMTQYFTIVGFYVFIITNIADFLTVPVNIIPVYFNHALIISNLFPHKKQLYPHFIEICIWYNSLMTNYTIALIEDEEITSKVVAEELIEAGFTVIKAFDGAEGLELIKAQMPDLVLLDIMMPKMQGFDVLKAVKADPNTKNIPVIILTVLSDDESVKKGIEMGANDYIVKSKHAVAEIPEKIKKFLKESPTI